jgi:hypothetical protein
MIEISNNDAFGVIKGVLSVFKRHTMFLLIEEIFPFIPFKTWFRHFILPYNYMGQYNTETLRVNVLPATCPVAAMHDRPLGLMINRTLMRERLAQLIDRFSRRCHLPQ